MGFIVLDYKEALAIDKTILKVKVPIHRTDIEMEEDLVEEVLRLYGYEKIVITPISAPAPAPITPSVYILEEKIRDLVTSLGLDEHTTSQIVKYNDENNEQIKLENSLSSEYNALRTNLWENLEEVAHNYSKHGIKINGVFEIGKVYKQKRIGDYIEQKQVCAVYNSSFYNKIKPDLESILLCLGVYKLSKIRVTMHLNNDLSSLDYLIENDLIARLFNTKYVLITENISKYVETKNIPFLTVRSSYVQKIIDSMSIECSLNTNFINIKKDILKVDESIKKVEFVEEYKNAKDKNKIYILLNVIFEDNKNKLSKSNLKDIRTEIRRRIESYGVKLRDY